MMPQRNFITNSRKQIIDPSKANICYDGEQWNASTDSANVTEQFAQKVVATAQKNNIPIQTDPTLIKHLMEVELGDSVPPQLYALIAEILIMIEGIGNSK